MWATARAKKEKEENPRTARARVVGSGFCSCAAGIFAPESS
jgi:hypothetical protein